MNVSNPKLISECIMVAVTMVWASVVILSFLKPHWFFKSQPPITELEPKALALAQSYMGEQWEDIPEARTAMVEIIHPLRDTLVRRENIQAVILSTWIRGYQAGRKARP